MHESCLAGGADPTIEEKTMTLMISSAFPIGRMKTENSRQYTSALESAASAGHKSMLRLLLDAIQQPNKFKNVPNVLKKALVSAARDGNMSIVQLLTDNGTNMDSAFDSAVEAATKHKTRRLPSSLFPRELEFTSFLLCCTLLVLEGIHL